MFTPRTLAIMAAAAGALASLPLSHAQACDNDRFPCPIIQDTSPPDAAADTSSRAAPTQPRKKDNQARKTDKASEKPEADALHKPAGAKTSKPAAQEQAASRSKASKPAAREQADASGAPVAAEAPVSAPPANTEIQAAPAPTANAAPAGAQAAAAAPGSATESANAPAAGDSVQMVDANEVNELDLAAAAPTPEPTGTSWLSYLLVTLGGALAAASTVRLFLF
jgi:hypothetical protein